MMSHINYFKDIKSRVAEKPNIVLWDASPNHRTMEQKIEYETREIVKSYLRIQEAIKCIDLSDSIRLS